jgi:Phosphodiester glycosidase
MPRQVFFSKMEEQVSIVEFDLNCGEDIFLTYSWGRERGPHIRRTGMGPPFMTTIGGWPGQTTTHPFGTRMGAWLIRASMRDDEIKKAEQELSRAKRAGSPADDVAVLEQTIEELRTIPAHAETFQQAYPDHEIVGQQGCGDLTMNAWNVAYVNNGLAKDPPALLHLDQEPLEHRYYSCLVKWKAREGRPVNVNIEEVRFIPNSNVRSTNELVWVRFEGQWYPRGNWIEFAVSNQQVIREGRVVPVVTTCHQFGDLRHLIQMPNLNPPEALYPGELMRQSANHRPRQYFNIDQHGDIWLGEEAFLRDASQNLLRASLSGPVYLDFPPDANERILRAALTRVGYKEAASALESLLPGMWRFVPRGPQQSVLEIYFYRNTYGWTMIGLSEDKRRVLCLACSGKAGKTGYTLEQAAELLLQAGAHNALLIDEGEDVFQTVRDVSGRLIDVIAPKRRRVRATFVFACPGLPATEG